MSKVDNFKNELHALLLKYNASIDWNCSDGSDTHGIYGQKMTVMVDNKEYDLSDDNYIDSDNFIK